MLVTTLPGTTTSTTDAALLEATYTYDVVANRAGQSALAATCSVFVGELDFVRGDVNQSGGVNISDAIGGLAYLFQGGALTCQDSLDMNDNGSLNIADVIGLLSYLFSGAAAPPAPFPGCGADLTPDTLECTSTLCP